MQRVVLCTTIVCSNFGTTAVVYPISRKARLLRKKYIGVWSLCSVFTMTRINPLPRMVRRYISRTSEKKTAWRP